MKDKEVYDLKFDKFYPYDKLGNRVLKEFNLENITKLCEESGNPQNNFKSIHVGGTNGKGSTIHLIGSILQEARYKVGILSSPHLINYRERIKVNGIPIPEEYINSFLSKNKNLIEDVKPTFFEVMAFLSFHYFSSVGVDFGLIEVGLGGRLDATNIIDPIFSIITNIGIDHTKYLGDTLEKIAKISH